MAKRVLYIGLHAWTSPIRVGSHAIAAQFARSGWEVAYIAGAISPINFLRPFAPHFSWRWRECRQGGARDLDGRLWHYLPFAAAVPTNRAGFRSHWLFHNWQHLTLPNLLAVVNKAGFGKVDLLFLDTIFQPFWLDAVQYQRCAVRMADYNAGFPGYGRAAQASEQLCIERADLVMTASSGLRDWAAARGARDSRYIPNGIDYAHFSETTSERPPEYAGFKGPIAVFVGDIGAWVDLGLIQFCARALPEVHFVMIGPNSKRFDPASFPANVHFLGLKPRSVIPAYLRHANVGLIPFRSEECPALIEHINPLKLYEYLAAGLPVVSTRWREMENLQSPARLCATSEEFLAAIKLALADTGSADSNRNFARSADWSTQLSPLIEWAG
ncbi:hypothetical protein BH11PSE11_BH11PSE11_38300 [soil metagenome]